MQGPPREDSTRISTRSSSKDVYRMMQGPLKEEFNRISIRAFLCKNLPENAAEGSPGPSWAQPGSILRTQCDTLKTCIFTAISNFFGLWWGFVQGAAHIGHVSGPASTPDARTQDQAAHAKPNLRPNMPKLRHVGPRVQRKLRPSWGQLGSCSAQLKAKDGQVWPRQVSPLLSSVLFPGCGRFSSRSDSNYTGKRPQTVWEVGSQCSRYKQQ